MTREEKIKLIQETAKLSSDELLLMIIRAREIRRADLVEIFKTYLLRALIREGFK